MARALCVVATSSSAGKSLIVSLILYHLRRRGVRAAPFKPQNMSLNSYPSVDGGEIALAQAMQAFAAGTEPLSCMNPVLLKPLGGLVEVVLRGRSRGLMSFAEYWRVVRARAKKLIRECFEELSEKYDAIIIEGAGCVAEPNFVREDIANLWVAREYGVPAIMVADIERGGAFASIIGSLRILPPTLRSLVKGFVINKFRGSKHILDPALEWLERKTKRRVLGVIPFIEDLRLWPEDSMNLEPFGEGPIDIAVIAYPTISNFSDLEPLRLEESVSVRIVKSKASLGEPHIILLPGSRNVFEALSWLKSRGLDKEIRKLCGSSLILGVCGGHQLLGKTISDPHGLEAGSPAHATGLGLGDYTIVYGREKIVSLTKAVPSSSNCFTDKNVVVEGYEIHRGRTVYAGTLPAFMIIERNQRRCVDQDGSVGEGFLTTMIHGILNNPALRQELLRKAGEAAGVKPSCSGGGWLDLLFRELEKAYRVFIENVDVDALEKMIGL